MNNVTEFIDVRLFYTKTGSAKYISHLDVMRAFQRALKRSKIDFWYTEGYGHLAYISDFNRDDVRNIKDATAIQKYIAGVE